MKTTTKLRWGVKSKNQLSLFMVWCEYWEGEEIVYGKVLFNSKNWIGF